MSSVLHIVSGEQKFTWRTQQGFLSSPEDLRNQEFTAYVRVHDICVRGPGFRRESGISRLRRGRLIPGIGGSPGGGDRRGVSRLHVISRVGDPATIHRLGLDRLSTSLRSLSVGGLGPGHRLRGGRRPLRRSPLWRAPRFRGRPLVRVGRIGRLNSLGI